MKTIALLIEYDGTRLAGWQRQSNAPTVQQHLEEALAALADSKVNVIGAGRTDAGVHAAGQVAHAQVPDNFPVPGPKIAIAINNSLPHAIRVLKAIVLSNPFHARFDANAREYIYRLSESSSVFRRRFMAHIKYPIDYSRLNLCCDIFKGRHDFTTFSKYNADTKHYRCFVDICRWTAMDGWHELRIRADRFVYGMVRALTGAMIDVARLRRTPEDIAKALAARNRKYISAMAPARGLTLNRIYYPDDIL